MNVETISCKGVSEEYRMVCTRLKDVERAWSEMEMEYESMEHESLGVLGLYESAICQLEEEYYNLLETKKNLRRKLS